MPDLTPNNVTTGKPKASGQVYIAASTVTAPTDATTALATGFKSLGYISEDGVTNSYKRTTEDIKDWSGSTVQTVQTEVSDEYKFTLIESTNSDVLNFVYGAGKFASNKLTVDGTELGEQKLVFEMMTLGGKAQRLYIPRAKVIELGDIVYKAGEAVGYEVTVKALHDGTASHYMMLES